MQFETLGPFLVFIGVILTSFILMVCFSNRRTRGMGRYIRCLNIAGQYERKSISELAVLCNMTEEEVIAAIQLGMRRGAPIMIEGDDFVRLADVTQQGRYSRTIVLVVCPNCGHKNQQGMTECSNCGAPV